MVFYPDSKILFGDKKERSTDNMLKRRCTSQAFCSEEEARHRRSYAAGFIYINRPWIGQSVEIESRLVVARV